MHDQIYLADVFQLQASQKAKGLKGYYLENGTIMPITVSRCNNRWGKIFLLTDEQVAEARKIEAQVAELKALWQRQLELANELVESSIVNNIIYKSK